MRLIRSAMEGGACGPGCRGYHTLLTRYFALAYAAVFVYFAAKLRFGLTEGMSSEATPIELATIAVLCVAVLALAFTIRKV